MEKLDLSNFDTHNVTDMSEMFLECAGLTELNISKFDTKNVTNMHAMFKGCKNLNFLDISNFIINENAIKDEMFYEEDGEIKQRLCTLEMFLGPNKRTFGIAHTNASDLNNAQHAGIGRASGRDIV